MRKSLRKEEKMMVMVNRGRKKVRYIKDQPNILLKYQKGRTEKMNRRNPLTTSEGCTCVVGRERNELSLILRSGK